MAFNNEDYKKVVYAIKMEDDWLTLSLRIAIDRVESCSPRVDKKNSSKQLMSGQSIYETVKNHRS